MMIAPTAMEHCMETVVVKQALSKENQLELFRTPNTSNYKQLSQQQDGLGELGKEELLALLRQVPREQRAALLRTRTQRQGPQEEKKK